MMFLDLSMINTPKKKVVISEYKRRDNTQFKDP